MLKLIVENTKADNPTMTIRWCVDPETFNKLRDMKVFDPFVLLTIYNVKSGREYRYAEKVSALMCYVPFRKPGENKIFATICWGTKFESVADRFLSKDRSGYKTSVLREDGTGFLGNLDDTLEQAMATVQVDAELFPKHPWDWRWVNLWFDRPPTDQCAFRKRRFLAYTLQPLLMAFFNLAYFCVMSIFALFTLLVGRLPKLSILNPFSVDIWEYTPDDVYQYQDWYFTQPYLKAFRPIFLVIAAGFGILFGIITNASSALAVIIPPLLAYGAVILCILVLNVVVLKIITLHRSSTKKKSITTDREQEKKERAEEKRRRVWAKAERKEAAAKEAQKLANEKKLEETQRALCSFVKQDAPMDIPKEAQTVGLRFNGLKRRVCRPFAD